jgi:hypothetical protein
MTAIQVRLTEFSELIDSYTADFVGCEWLVKHVDTLLVDPVGRFVILTGSACVGKSVFIAHLAATHPYWLRYFSAPTAVNLCPPAMVRRSSLRLERSSQRFDQSSSSPRDWKLSLGIES